VIGQTVGHYRILAKLGEGGMGVVYEAEDLRLKRRVALKFLPPAATRSPRARQRFVLEAQAASALDHINICTVHEIDETEDGRVFIAMARYEGETVREKIGRGPLSLGEALDIAQQTARGLAEAHGRGIVHRDIKPGNVFVTNAGVVKILDFGLAKLAGVLSLTETGTAIGTAPYMSPEQTRASDVDHRTDIWSLGVLLYEMLAATPPFSGEHTAAVVQSILNETPPPISRVRAGVPAELTPVLQKALAKKPEKRFQRVDDLLASLLKISSLSGSEIRTKSAPMPRRPSPPLTRYKAAAVLAALVLAAGLYLLQGGFAPQSGRVDSIAVLPFENLSSDLEQQYFVDGMHDALIADLAQIHALKVISRTSVERYRESEKTIPEIARELNVDAVVEGSVLRSKDQVRITVQLIRGSTDEHLWASSYERDLKNVLALVGEAAQAISDEIEVALSPEEKAHFAENHEVDTEAHEAYLKGRYFVNKFTGKDLRKSVQYFRESVEIDPDFALGWAGLAGAHVLIAYLGDEREAVDKAETAAARALALRKGHRARS